MQGIMAMDFKYVLKLYVLTVSKKVMKFNLPAFEEEDQVENINKHKCKTFLSVMGFITFMLEFQYYACNIVNTTLLSI